MTLYRKFEKFIAQKNLFKLEEKILLAVSGGIDSLVMTDLFHKTGIKFGIAHCNFGLRGSESEADEAFVRQVATTLDCDFYSIKFDTLKFAEQNKVSVQMAARTLRYDWFEEVKEKIGYACVATAHHLDDEVETFLINLIRGTGIAGLHGIAPKQNNLVRPLLFTNRTEIENHAKINNIEFREDSSNKSINYLRNNIRLQVLPQLEKLNPSIKGTIKKEIERLSDVEQIFNASIEKEKSRCTSKNGEEIWININLLKTLQPLKTYLFEFLKPYNYSEDLVEAILIGLNSDSGKKFFSSTHQLLKDRKYLIISPSKAEETSQVLISKSTIEVEHPIKIKLTVVKNNQSWKPLNNALFAYLDYEKMDFPLTLRKWENGDAFTPFGMKGKKKISDFLIDEKINLNQKNNTYVIESKGVIAWIIGHRISELFKITSTTNSILVLEFQDSTFNSCGNKK